MLNLWNLPRKAEIGEEIYCLNCDFRDILEIFSYLNDPDLPDFIKWRVALRLFYGAEIPPQYRQEAIAYFTDFIGCGEKGTGKPVPQLLCWQQDAPIIIGEVNRVAGQEIREKPFVHWWTFLAWFHAVGEGQLSFLVSLRDKLRRGQKLEAWEETYYRENREKVDISPRYTQREKDQREKLLALLDGKKEQVN